MIKWILLCLPLSAIAGSHQASEEKYPTAEEMMGWCDAYKTSTSDGELITVTSTMHSQACYGAFLTAQQFATTALDRRSRTSVLKVCVPGNAGLLELMKVFMHYMDEHPQRGHEKFTDVLLASWWEAWPCSASLNSKSPS
jgi:Rap1a immunity proteins